METMRAFDIEKNEWYTNEITLGSMCIIHAYEDCVTFKLFLENLGTNYAETHIDYFMQWTFIKKRPYIVNI